MADTLPAARSRHHAFRPVQNLPDAYAPWKKGLRRRLDHRGRPVGVVRHRSRNYPDPKWKTESSGRSRGSSIAFARNERMKIGLIVSAALFVIACSLRRWNQKRQRPNTVMWPERACRRLVVFSRRDGLVTRIHLGSRA